MAFLLFEPFGYFGTEWCHDCGVYHDLVVRRTESGWWAMYDRNTLRHPEEHDGEPLEAVVRVRGRQSRSDHGPIEIAPRKKRFSRGEVETIWKRTSGLCHLCRKRTWRLEDRGIRGWHIDHVLPNAGGAYGTEEMHNFLVACAKCNLQKGRGYRHGEIQGQLSRFMETWGH